MPSMLDAVVVGAGPNGLTAAVELARRGFSVAVFEAKETVGGGARTEELTLPGFRHDPCSAAHPLGINSPAFRALPLERHGLEWLQPELPMAHPFPDGTAAVLARSVAETAASFGPRDAGTYRRLVAPFLDKWDTLAKDFMSLPATALPRDPVTLARFGLVGLPPRPGCCAVSARSGPRACSPGSSRMSWRPSAASPPPPSASSSRWRRTPGAGPSPGAAPRPSPTRSPDSSPSTAAPCTPTTRSSGSTTCRRPGRTSSTPRPPRWPASRTSAGPTRTTATAPASSRSTTRWTAPCPGPRRRPASPAPCRSAPPAPTSAPPCTPPPGAATPPRRPS